MQLILSLAYLPLQWQHLAFLVTHISLWTLQTLKHQSGTLRALKPYLVLQTLAVTIQLTFKLVIHQRQTKHYFILMLTKNSLVILQVVTYMLIKSALGQHHANTLSFTQQPLFQLIYCLTISKLLTVYLVQAMTHSFGINILNQQLVPTPTASSLLALQQHQIKLLLLQAV